MKKIVHLDFNYFFVQVEELFDPSLRNIPVAVGSPIGRGIISTSNYIAREKGVKSGMAVALALKACPNLKLVHENYRKYGEKSDEIFSYLRSQYKLLQQISCDECFIDMTDILQDGYEYDQLRDLQFEIYKRFKIKVSIGLSFTRFLAKMASDYKKPLGLTIITKDNIEKLLYPLPIKDFWGIGKKTSPILEKNGIKTIGDFVKNKNNIAYSIMNNQYYSFVDYIKGNTSDIVEQEIFDPKSCSAVETLTNDTSDYEEIKTVLTKVSYRVYNELKKYNKEAKTVVLILRDNKFVTKSRRTTLKDYIDDQESILNAALKIFSFFSKEDTPYRLVGIGLDNLREIDSNIKISKSDDVDKIIDTFNDLLNSDLLKKTSQIK